MKARQGKDCQKHPLFTGSEQAQKTSWDFEGFHTLCVQFLTLKVSTFAVIEAQTYFTGILNSSMWLAAKSGMHWVALKVRYKARRYMKIPLDSQLSELFRPRPIVNFHPIVKWYVNRYAHMSLTWIITLREHTRVMETNRRHQQSGKRHQCRVAIRLRGKSPTAT